MKILAVEFSSERRSVAVMQAAAGACPLLLGRAAESEVHRPLNLVEEALRQARSEREEIEMVAIGLGPGSYAGIRGAIALAQGWQLGRGVRLTGVSSVECLAALAEAEKWYGPANIIVDAQRTEFYLARYDINPGAWHEVTPLRLASLAEIEELARRGERLLGPGAAEWFKTARSMYPSADCLGRLACSRRDYAAGEKLEPIYLRETAFKKAAPARVI